jgi:DNA-binding CsgD family transcriptional regulator
MSAGSGDDRSLRVAILDLLARFVPFDSYAFLLTDPSTTVGCSPVAEVPDLETLPDLIRLKYLTDVNRWTRLPTPGCATLQAATAGHPEESLVWREHLAQLGILDVLSVVFSDRFGCWGFLDLWRCGRHFAEDEVAAIAGARAAVTSQLRRVQAAGFTAVGSFQREHRPGALILSPALEVRAQTPQTRDWMEALVPPESGRRVVPASAYNVAAQLLANEAGVDAHPPLARVHLGGGAWLTLRADRLSAAGPAGGQDIAVTMQASSSGERREVFSRAHALTQREDLVLRHLVEGADTRTVARAMSISELTVQDHLKSAFAKTSTSSRRELLAKSLGR